LAGDLSGMGRFLGHRDGAGRVYPPGRARCPNRRQPRRHLWHLMRKLPAVYYRDPARPCQRGGGTAARGIPRPAMTRLGAIFSVLCLAALLWGLWLIWAPQPATLPPPGSTQPPA